MQKNFIIKRYLPIVIQIHILFSFNKIYSITVITVIEINFASTAKENALQ